MTTAAAPGRRGGSGDSPSVPGLRRSYALEGFASSLTAQEGLHVIDLGGLNQPNLDFLAGLGHRVFAVDFLLACQQFFRPEELAAPTVDDARLLSFLDDSLDFPDQTVDGVLAWDVLQFLPTFIASAVLERFHRALAPDALILSLFHPDSRPRAAPLACRIHDGRMLALQPRGPERACAPFTARSIERFFHRFASVRFFMTKDSLQEVLARR